MGQDQSSASREDASSLPSEDGVQVVEGSGSGVASGNTRSQVDQLLAKSQALRLPQQILPPPPVKDDVSSALQGAQMIHDLRSALGGLLLGIEENPNLRSQSPQQEESDPNDRDDATPSDSSEGADAERDSGDVSEIMGDLQRRASSIDEFSMVTEADTRAEQDKWARLGIDHVALNAVIEQCTGGKELTEALMRQEKLMERIILAKEKAIRLRKAMDRNGEEAKRTTRALERLDRIHVALSDVQDTLESAVATANILGAAHFSHDDEMCSFKNFLKHNPPKVL